MVEDAMRAGIRRAIADRDIDGLTFIAWETGLAGYGDTYSTIAHEELAAADHDTQQWWGLPCNCSGHLN